MRHQDAANLGGTGEADVTHHVAGTQHFADGNAVVGVGGQHIEYTGRQASTDRQFGNRERAQGREFSRLDDDRAACSQRWRHLARDHGVGEIPGRDGGADANGLAQHQDAPRVVKLGQGLAVDALGFFGKPFHEIGAVGDFALGFGQRLALLSRHDATQIVLVGHQQIKPLAQDDAALLGGLVAPGRPGGVGGSDGEFGLNRSQIGHIGQFLASGGVDHVEAAAAFDPLTVDQRIGLEQASIFEQGQRGAFLVHGMESLQWGSRIQNSKRS